MCRHSLKQEEEIQVHIDYFLCCLHAGPYWAYIVICTIAAEGGLVSYGSTIWRVSIALQALEVKIAMMDFEIMRDAQNTTYPYDVGFRKVVDTNIQSTRFRPCKVHWCARDTS